MLSLLYLNLAFKTMNMTVAGTGISDKQEGFQEEKPLM